MIKRALRRWLLWSSRGPLLPIYRGLYRVVIRVGVFVLRRRRGVLAIYLTRGCAKGQITPGISDIDFMVVTEEDGDCVASVRRTCAALGWLTGNLIEYYPALVMSKAAFESRWHGSPIWRYRLEEGKATWQLLHGVDVRASLPAISAAELEASCFAEMSRWWLQFAVNCLRGDGGRGDPVLTNVACYKAITEFANARHALMSGHLRYSREAALAELPPMLSAKVASVAAGRFLGPADGLPDEALRFLVKSFLEVWGAYGPRLQPKRQTLSDLRNDGRAPDTTCRRIERLRAYASEALTGQVRGVRVARSSLWDADDVLVIFEVAEGNFPAVAEIAALTAFQSATAGEGPGKAFLFFELGPLAFPVTPILPRDYHRGLLTRESAPDVLIELGEKAAMQTDREENA